MSKGVMRRDPIAGTAANMPVVLVKPASSRLALDLRDLWHYRDLFLECSCPLCAPDGGILQTMESGGSWQHTS
jgi:hypothetical protein